MSILEPAFARGEPPGTETGAAALRARGLSVGYDRQPVLRRVDLEVGPADCCLLYGPNGSGKTTLIKTLLGLLPPLAGRIERPARLRLTYVPTVATLSPTLPLRLDEVALMGAYRLRPWRPGYGRDVRQRARAYLERLGLRTRRGQAFTRSSSGEKQRTLLARALVGEPHVLLMDEPSANLDTESLGYFMDTLQRLREERVGLVIATHMGDLFRPLRPAVLAVRHGTVSREAG